MSLAGFELLLLVLVILPVMLALVDIFRSRFQGTYTKLIWVLAVLFLNIIGVVLYFFIGRNQRHSRI